MQERSGRDEQKGVAKESFRFYTSCAAAGYHATLANPQGLDDCKVCGEACVLISRLDWTGDDG